MDLVENNSNIGCVFIWTRNQIGVWSEQQKLVGSNNIGPSGQGVSVALSADGNMVAFGGNNDNNFIGAVWVFNYSKEQSKWIETVKIVAPDYEGNSYQGTSIALSSNNTLIYGGIGNNNFIGAVWVYQLLNGIWMYQQKLTGSNAVSSPKQGTSVAISGDSRTIVFGGTDDNDKLGATWVFIREDTNWIEIDKLVIVGTTVNNDGYVAQGISVSLKQ